MAERSTEFVGSAGRYRTKHDVWCQQFAREVEQTVQSLVHSAVATDRHEAARTFGKCDAREFGCMSWRLRE
jgi:hypothetical protein